MTSRSRYEESSLFPPISGEHAKHVSIRLHLPVARREESPVSFRFPYPARANGHEWLDDMQAAGITTTTLAHSLREVHRMDSLAGGTRTLMGYVKSMLPGSSARVLDVGTGAGDIPVTLLRWASYLGVELDVTGLDNSPPMLDVARDFIGDAPVDLVLADARALPFPDSSFDVVTSLGFLHHFDPEELPQVLRELWRVARVGMVMVDLERSYPTYLLGRLVLRTVVRNPLTRHDGLISIERAYTAPELRELSRLAGLPQAVVKRHSLCLVALSLRKG